MQEALIKSIISLKNNLKKKKYIEITRLPLICENCAKLRLI